jgi:hypothetical protein
MRHNLLGSRFCSSEACSYRAHPQCAASRQSRQIQEKAQDYSGFGLKSQTPTPKSAQLASRAPARAELAMLEAEAVAAGRSLIDLAASRLALRAPALRAASTLTRPTRSAQRLPCDRRVAPTGKMVGPSDVITYQRRGRARARTRRVVPISE